jgi:hypothetical protein
MGASITPPAGDAAPTTQPRPLRAATLDDFNSTSHLLRIFAISRSNAGHRISEYTHALARLTVPDSTLMISSESMEAAPSR